MSYTQGWWRSNYCGKVLGTNARGACNNPTPDSACNLTLVLGELPENLQDIATSVCDSLGEASTEVDVCKCLPDPGPNNGGNNATVSNTLAFFFNMVLKDLGNLTNPSRPKEDTCTDSSYLPAADTYVCTTPDAEEDCPCPSTPLSQWGPYLSASLCYDFVNNAIDEGVCLPAVDSKSPNCRVQKCPCGNEAVSTYDAACVWQTPLIQTQAHHSIFAAFIWCCHVLCCHVTRLTCCWLCFTHSFKHSCYMCLPCRLPSPNVSAVQCVTPTITLSDLEAATICETAETVSFTTTLTNDKAPTSLTLTPPTPEGCTFDDSNDISVTCESHASQLANASAVALSAYQPEQHTLGCATGSQTLHPVTGDRQC